MVIERSQNYAKTFTLHRPHPDAPVLSSSKYLRAIEVAYDIVNLFQAAIFNGFDELSVAGRKYFDGVVGPARYQIFSVFGEMQGVACDFGEGDFDDRLQTLSFPNDDFSARTSSKDVGKVL